MRVLLPPSPNVYLMESEEADQTKPAPVDLDDPQAFYALLHGHSMVPTGIGPADFCLVSPCAKLEPGQRIWLRDWQPPKPNGHQDRSPSGGERKDVDDRSLILAVYRGWLVPSDPVHHLPDWHLADSPVCGGRCSTRSRSSRWWCRNISKRDLLLQPEDHGWLEWGSVQRSGMRDLLQQIENVKQLAQFVVTEIGSVPQRVRSAWRTVDQSAGRRAGEQRAVTEPALA